MNKNRNLTVVWLAATLLFAAACSDESDPDRDLGVSTDSKVSPADRGMFPDGYRLYSCKVPGQSCNAHDPCAINPICGKDNLCRPQGLMDCKDDLECTVDTCAGLGICENKPKAGFCKLPVRVGGPPDLGTSDGGGADGGAADAGVLPDYGAAKTVFKCFKKGERNPNDQCQVCEPGGDDTGVAGDPTHWTAANGGSCNDGDPCTVNDYCQAGTCKGTSYRAKCATGYACVTAACDGKGGCLAPTLKTGWCLINGACYQDKAAHPTGACLTCDSSVNPAVWTPITNTCNIGGKCYAKGAPNPAGCGECDPAVSTSAWTVSGTTCCLINGTGYKAGTKDSTGCSVCDPTKSTTAWTALSGLCLISGKCYQKGDKHPQGCAECVPSTSSTSWTVTGTTHCLINNTCITSGTKNPATGSCSSCQPSNDKYNYYPDSNYCKIAGTCIQNGTAHPDGCATCDVSKDPTKWSPKTANDCLINNECATVCSGTCVDTQSNPSNCGTCGKTCGTATPYCAGGTCIAAAPSCKAVLASNPSASSGTYDLVPAGTTTPFKAYCDMDSDGGGWTLVARFSNADGSQWIDKADYWYDTVTEVGTPTSRSDNKDALSKAFWTVKGDELRISRTDNTTDAHLLMTNNKCLSGKTMRDKITGFGNYRTGTWASDAVRGTCSATLGNNYSSTSGFKYATCSGNIGKPRSVSFFADWSSGDGAVMMIGGGGSSCGRADHGLAATEANSASFGSTYTRKDFGEDSPSGSSAYSLNLWVR